MKIYLATMDNKHRDPHQAAFSEEALIDILNSQSDVGNTSSIISDEKIEFDEELYEGLGACKIRKMTLLIHGDLVCHTYIWAVDFLNEKEYDEFLEATEKDKHLNALN